MLKNRQGVTRDEWETVVRDLIDQVKVLVEAVDDLRCEIEWQHRNSGGPAVGVVAGPEERLAMSAQPTEAKLPGGANSPLCDTLSASMPAARPLWAFEAQLMSAPIVAWSDEWADEDLPELPTDCVISVDEDIWLSVLNVRPAHLRAIEDDGCEPDCGAPYLMAWRESGACFLRELTEDEAIELQRLCLAARGSETLPTDRGVSRTQQSLW